MVTMNKELHITEARWLRTAFRAWRIISWPLPEKWRRRVACKIIVRGTKLSWR